MAAVRLDFGLEEMRSRVDSTSEYHLQGFPREQLETTGHIGKPGSQQKIAKHRPTAAYPVSLEIAIDDAAPLAEARPKDTVISHPHGIPELWYVRGIVAKSGIN